MDIQSFAEMQLKLLDRELQAELAETNDATKVHSQTALQRAGFAILNLIISNQKSGLGGRTVIELEVDHAIGKSKIPEHGIRVGDIVGLREQHGGSAKKSEKAEIEKRGLDAVVIKISDTTISVAPDKDEFELPNGKMWLVKLANDVTYKRMNQTMTRMLKLSESGYSPFMNVLFGRSSPAPVKINGIECDIEWVSPSLNDSQREAIKFAIASKEIALIHGPPGTGKTHTLIELILQLLKENKKLLVCGPSNVSVDNIIERLSQHKVPMVRLGHPARLLPSVLTHSLDVLTRTGEAAALIQDVRKEMDEKQASIRKTRNGRERKAIYGDLRELRKEYRERERDCVENLVRSSKVVLSTLHGAGGYQLRHAEFDVVIIDEASQALEAQCWVALLTAKKAVLAGDHLQLPPTIKSMDSKTNAVGKINKDSESRKPTLERTLFDRLLDLHGPDIKRMLTTQYRMHEKIMAFPSTALYDGKLIAAEAVKERLLKDLEYGVDNTEDTTEPLVFIDTQGGDFPEKFEDEDLGKTISKKVGLGDSKRNEMEALLVHEHVKKLVEAGVKPQDIAVITPYNAQLSLLSQALKEAFVGIELGSVDGFQGREKEAVVVSLVRSNAEHEVGFLGERRRLNVAMTRPMRHLCVIGDSETITKGSPFLKAWMQYLEENADLRYPDPSTITL